MDRKPLPKVFKTTVRGRVVEFEIPDAVFAHFSEQFAKRTPAQQRRKRTLMNIVRFAYLAGLREGGRVARKAA